MNARHQQLLPYCQARVMIPAHLSSTMLARVMPISVVWPEGQELEPCQPFLMVEDVRQHRARG